MGQSLALRPGMGPGGEGTGQEGLGVEGLAPRTAPPHKALQPTLATTNPALLGTNVLQAIDHALQEVVEAIMCAQEAAAGGAAGIVRLASGGRAVLQLDQPVSIAELRRHKRAMIKLATKVTFTRISDAATVQRMFVDYLISNVANASRPPSYL